MTPARWRDVTRVYAAVVGRDPAARGEALAAACGNDEALRREVEALLAEDAGARATILDRRLGETAAAVGLGDLTGRLLGPYRIEAPIGAGGMGQVYRATDTRLQRTVAIKILPAELSTDPQFRARFDREAKAIAALNNPRICALFDVGSDAGFDYLVLEYLEGETLASRLERGPLPLAQALQTAIEIAEALAAAHRRGIVHRDLKPGNVMLTKGGVKLLDFGLARLRGEAASAGQAVSASMLPTTPPLGQAAGPLTAQGTILGTFQYMAPEQLEGREADARTDIFALGVVMYELVTGKKAFEGKSQASLIGAIMHGEPAPMTTVQPVTPPALERSVRTCLAKDPDARWQSAADLARELRWITDAPAERNAPTSRRRSPIWMAIAGLAGLAVTAASGYVGYVMRPAAPARVIRFTIPPPADGRFTGNPGGGNAVALSVSPDGRWVAYSGMSDGVARLFLRALDRTYARPLPGTDGGRYPFWSPDSRSLAFFTQTELKRVDIAGGAAVKLADVYNGVGGTWSRSGVIVFGTVSQGLFQLPAGAATPVQLRTLGDTGQARLPVFLPDGVHFLYWDRLGQSPDGVIRVGSLDGSASSPLVQAVRGIAFAAGHLLFVRGQTLFAQPFDAAGRQLTGTPTLIAEPVTATQSGGYAAFSVSDTGVLAYGTGGSAPRQAQWINRDGHRIGSVGTVGTQTGIELSSDGHRMLATRVDPVTLLNTVSMFDIARQIDSTVTTGGNAVLSPEAKWIAFTRLPNALGLGRIRSDGSGPVEPIVQKLCWPTDWSRDGRWLLIQHPEPQTGIDISLVDLQRGNAVTPLVATTANEGEGHFSPDQSWFAYTSEKGGRREVYVQRLASGGEVLQISSGGGSQPRWRADGKELFYVASNQMLMSAAIDQVGDRLRARSPTPLFRINAPISPSVFGLDVEPSADGRTFLVNEAAGPVESATLTVILNWPELLREGT